VNWRCGAEAGQWTALGRDLKPVFGVTTGIRRTNHGLPEENRWDVFWDVPLNHTNDVRRFTASYHARRCEGKTDGARLEISFPGLEMGLLVRLALRRRRIEAWSFGRAKLRSAGIHCRCE
jgi:hypothetical protein